MTTSPMSLLSNRRPASHAAIVLAVAAFAFAACAGGSGASPNSASSGPASNSTPISAPVGGAGSVEDGLGHPVNVCALLPADTVATITGEPITKAEEDDTLSYKLYACNYSSADGTSGLSVSVLALDAAAGYDANVQANGAGAKQISGLGDKAYSAITGVEALFGNVSITVSNLQSDAAAETLIRTLQPKL